MVRFSCEASGTSGRMVLVVAGEVDLAAADRLSEALDRGLVPDGVLAVDLSAVTFIDSMGLRTLIKAAQKADEVDARLRLAAVPAAVTRVLELAGVSGLFNVLESIERALED